MKQRERRWFLKNVGVSSTGILLSGMPAVVANAVGKPPSHPRRAVLEGPFGRAEVDLQKPSLTRLDLREDDGTLIERSVLSEHASGFPAWAVGATSYYVDKQGRRYESRFSTSHQVVGTQSRERLQLSGIRPSTAAGQPLACLEDWRLEVTATGALRWEIRRHFEHSLEAVLHGGPALFFNTSPNTGRTPQTSTRLNPAANGLVLSWWVTEEALVGEPLKEYQTGTSHEVWFPTNKSTTMRKKNGWAIFKFYPSFRCNSDLMVSTCGGHLYRRGRYWSFAEIGVTAGPAAGATFQAGDEGVLAIEIGPVPQEDSGQQLMVELPDKPMEQSLKRFFGGLANAGCLADCEKHILGNECDGYFFAGNMRFHAYALLSSCRRRRRLSSAPTSYETAYRKTLGRNLNSVDARGSITAGFAHGSGMPELPMSNILGLESYLFYRGDIEFVRAHRPALERMDRYLKTWLKDGLFYAPQDRIKQAGRGANWYYDEVRGAHGYTLFHNVLYSRTLKSLQILFSALGDTAAATQARAGRKAIIDRINDVLWDDHAYGSGRGGYYDWIREDGDQRAYFFACNQYAAIVHEVADEGQRDKILRTADERLAELQHYFRHAREATLDCLWPLRTGDIQRRHLRFGGLMDGGMLPPMTFWEVTARCLAGDPNGAYDLLKRFSARAAETNWYEGVNAFSMQGSPRGWDGDPYLGDQLVVAASVIHGFFGVKYEWAGFEVHPHLPDNWEEAQARIMFKGVEYSITANHGESTVES